MCQVLLETFVVVPYFEVFLVVLHTYLVFFQGTNHAYDRVLTPVFSRFETYIQKATYGVSSLPRFYFEELVRHIENFLVVEMKELLIAGVKL